MVGLVVKVGIVVDIVCPGNRLRAVGPAVVIRRNPCRALVDDRPAVAKDVVFDHHIGAARIMEAERVLRAILKRVVEHVHVVSVDVEGELRRAVGVFPRGVQIVNDVIVQANLLYVVVDLNAR